MHFYPVNSRCGRRYKRYNSNFCNRLSIVIFTIVLNILLFSAVFILFPRYLSIVSSEVQIALSKKLLMGLISGLIVSCAYFLIAGATHVISLKKNGMSISDCITTDDLGSEMLRTGFIILSFMLLYRVCYKLYSLCTNSLTNKKLESEVKNTKRYLANPVILIRESSNVIKNGTETHVNLETLALKLKSLKQEFFYIRTDLSNLSVKVSMISRGVSLLRSEDVKKIESGLMVLEKHFLNLENYLKSLIKKQADLEHIKDQKLLKRSILKLHKGCIVCKEKQLIIKSIISEIEGLMNSSIETGRVVDIMKVFDYKTKLIVML